MTGDRPSSARPDLRERIARRFFRVVNPLARRMIPAGVATGAPNILLIVRGRRSGIERTTPVAMLDFDGHSYVQASYGATGWARNLRAAGEATIIPPLISTIGGHQGTSWLLTRLVFEFLFYLSSP